jgi:capsular exopolysaccharide synthesis family protein
MDNQDLTSPLPKSSSETSGIGQLREYWLVVLERRWLIVTLLTLSIVAGFLYAFTATQIYRATATLQIDPESSGALSLRDLLPNVGRDQEYLQTQYRNLQSRTLLEKLVERFKLADDPRYAKEPDRAAALEKDLTISPVRLTRIVQVHMNHPEPAKARDIVNALLDLFIEDNQTQKSFRALTGYRQLRQEAQSQENELTKAIQALQDYRRDKGSVSLEADVNIVAMGFRHAKESYEAQQVRSETAIRLASEANRWRQGGKEIADFPEVAKDPQVAQVKLALGNNLTQFSIITNRYGPKHPSYKSLASAIAVDQGRLAAEAVRAFNSMQAQADIEKNNLDGSRKKLADAEAEVTKLNDIKVQYDVLSRKKERVESMYQAILVKTKEYDMSSKELVQNMRIVDPADVPARPIKPNKPLVIVGSLVGGLVLGLGLALFINFLDDSVKSQEDIEVRLGQRFLGYIPHTDADSVVERDLQSHLDPTSTVGESFRTLRAGVFLAQNADKLRTIVISSTEPSEGKSLIASNFAIVTAQTGLRTLLMDADLRRPSVHEAFQIKAPLGLTAYLAGKTSDLASIISPSEVPNLDILCSGPTPSNPSELISSQRMTDLLTTLSQRYDRIVIDCPPVSAVADPLVVGSKCDGMIYVTKFNTVRREILRRCLQRLHEADISVIGVVLNDIDFRGSDAYYYNYHYYQNRYYSSHYKTKGSEDSSPTDTKTGSDSSKA